MRNLLLLGGLAALCVDGAVTQGHGDSKTARDTRTNAQREADKLEKQMQDEMDDMVESMLVFALDRFMVEGGEAKATSAFSRRRTLKQGLAKLYETRDLVQQGNELLKERDAVVDAVLGKSMSLSGLATQNPHLHAVVKAELLAVRQAIVDLDKETIVECFRAQQVLTEERLAEDYDMEGSRLTESVVRVLGVPYLISGGMFLETIRKIDMLRENRLAATESLYVFRHEAYEQINAEHRTVPPGAFDYAVVKLVEHVMVNYSQFGARKTDKALGRIHMAKPQLKRSLESIVAALPEVVERRGVPNHRSDHGQNSGRPELPAQWTKMQIPPHWDNPFYRWRAYGSVDGPSMDPKDAGTYLDMLLAKEHAKEYLGGHSPFFSDQSMRGDKHGLPLAAPCLRVLLADKAFAAQLGAHGRERLEARIAIQEWNNDEYGKALASIEARFEDSLSARSVFGKEMYLMFVAFDGLLRQEMLLTDLKRELESSEDRLVDRYRVKLLETMSYEYVDQIPNFAAKLEPLMIFWNGVDAAKEKITNFSWTQTSWKTAHLINHRVEPKFGYDSKHKVEVMPEHVRIACDELDAHPLLGMDYYFYEFVSLHKST